MCSARNTTGNLHLIDDPLPSTGNRSKKSSRSFLLIGIISVAIIVFGAWYFWPPQSAVETSEGSPSGGAKPSQIVTKTSEGSPFGDAKSETSEVSTSGGASPADLSLIDSELIKKILKESNDKRFKDSSMFSTSKTEFRKYVAEEISEAIEEKRVYEFTMKLVKEGQSNPSFKRLCDTDICPRSVWGALVRSKVHATQYNGETIETAINKFDSKKEGSDTADLKPLVNSIVNRLIELPAELIVADLASPDTVPKFLNTEVFSLGVWKHAEVVYEMGFAIFKSFYSVNLMKLDKKILKNKFKDEVTNSAIYAKTLSLYNSNKFLYRNIDWTLALKVFNQLASFKGIGQLTDDEMKEISAVIQDLNTREKMYELFSPVSLTENATNEEIALDVISHIFSKAHAQRFPIYATLSNLNVLRGLKKIGIDIEQREVVSELVSDFFENANKKLRFMSLSQDLLNEFLESQKGFSDKLESKDKGKFREVLNKLVNSIKLQDSYKVTHDLKLEIVKTIKTRLRLRV